MSPIYVKVYKVFLAFPQVFPHFSEKGLTGFYGGYRIASTEVSRDVAEQSAASQGISEKGPSVVLSSNRHHHRGSQNGIFRGVAEQSASPRRISNRTFRGVTEQSVSPRRALRGIR